MRFDVESRRPDIANLLAVSWQRLLHFRFVPRLPISSLTRFLGLPPLLLALHLLLLSPVPSLRTSPSNALTGMEMTAAAKKVTNPAQFSPHFTPKNTTSRHDTVHSSLAPMALPLSSCCHIQSHFPPPQTLTTSQHSMQAYQQKLGYPAQIKGGTIAGKTPAQNKKDGWTYRPPGEGQEFGSSDKFYGGTPPPFPHSSTRPKPRARLPHPKVVGM